MPYRRQKPIISELVHIAIKCGACGKTSKHTSGVITIMANGCNCYPDTMTCMCDLGKYVEFQCPNAKCKYSGSIEIY